jgi:carbon-monoxide dehydrogenase small subunit
MLAVDVHGREVTTIEGLAENEELHPLQQSFMEKGAVQCGFCTPAMILSAKALLEKTPEAGEEEIKQGLSGVLCRCGSYNKIVKAVLTVNENMGSAD